MLPLLPFIAGIATGAVAIKLWRNDKAAQTLENAKVKIREATVSGLSRLESSTAAVRDKLATPETETAAAGEAVVAAKATPTRARKPATKAAAESAKKPAVKRASKPKAAKPQAPAGDAA